MNVPEGHGDGISREYCVVAAEVTKNALYEMAGQVSSRLISEGASATNSFRHQRRTALDGVLHCVKPASERAHTTKKILPNHLQPLWIRCLKLSVFSVPVLLNTLL